MKKQTVVTTFRAVPELLRLLDEKAAALGMTRNGLIVQTLWESVHKNSLRKE